MKLRVAALVASLSSSTLVMPVLADQGHAHDHKSGTAQASPHAQALGRPGDPGKVSRTVDVSMSDGMRFAPSRIAVKRNETIRFLVKNDGKVKHEMVLGTLRELKEHAALMRKFPGMEHEDPNSVTVEPGTTGTLIWQFTRAGSFDFGCLVPGHFEAGMAGKISVSP